MINTKSSIDPNELRKLFPIFAKRSLVYLDSAATSQKPEIVISTCLLYTSDAADE